jgi:hypothetical protein
MRASRICTVILFASSALAQRSNPCDARYHLFPPSDCTTALERIAESVVQLRAAIAQENAKMAEFRRKFWATYPDKPGAAEARDEFGKAPNAKDIYYLELIVKQAGGGAKGIDFLGGKLDGGIPRNASAEFADWAEEISRNWCPRLNSG